MQKVNFLMYDCQPDLFVKRYKRRLKNWTIDEIHDLWLRTCERSTKRHKEKSDFIKEIVKEVTANERGEHIVYFKHRNDKSDSVHCYKISWNSDWKSYGISQDTVNPKTRDEKLTFILAKDREFELGQKLHHLNYMCSDIQWNVRGIMWRMVEEELQKKFKGETQIPDVFIIKIGSKKYYVELDSQHRIGYLQFHLKNEHTDGEYIAFGGSAQSEKVAKNPLNFSTVTI